METLLLARLFTGVTFLFVSAQSVLAEEVSLTPAQIVEEWMNSYPHNLERAVMLTTPAMREDLTPNQWIMEQNTLVAQGNVKYRDRHVVSTKNEGYQIVAILKTQYSTTNGEREQWEHITLKPFCSTWLIDEIELSSVRHQTNTK